MNTKAEIGTDIVGSDAVVTVGGTWDFNDAFVWEYAIPLHTVDARLRRRQE